MYWSLRVGKNLSLSLFFNQKNSFIENIILCVSNLFIDPLTSLCGPPQQEYLTQYICIKVVNSVLIGVLFFQLEWNVSVLKCFSVSFWNCTVHTHTHIYSINIIQIQDKLVINYAIQTHCQTNIISKFKIFLNSQD
jgi:hypothetical protein